MRRIEARWIADHVTGLYHIRSASAARVAGWVLACLICGCAANPAQRAQLNDGEAAFRAARATAALDSSGQPAHQPLMEYEKAIQDADAVLASGDHSMMAEAHYLKGRALEDRPKTDAAAAARDLALARVEYVAALKLIPPIDLTARLHTQIANVAYHQNDYPTAMLEWTRAYDMLDRQDWKVWVLYYMGSCEQRMGRFTDADRTFEKVQTEFPGTDAAKRSRLTEGVHGFYVQVGAFSHQPEIDRAAAAITAAGARPMRASKGSLTIVRTAEIPTYMQSEAVRDRLAAQYADATIVP